MSSATERLAKLREEKEKLAVLSKKVNPKKDKKKLLGGLFKKKEKKPEVKKEKEGPVKQELPKKIEEKKEEKVETKKEEVTQPKSDQQQVEKKVEQKKPEIKKEEREKSTEKKDIKKETDVKKKGKEKKGKERKKTAHERMRFFSNLIEKSGIDLTFNQINKRIFLSSLITISVVTIYLLINFFVKHTFLSDAIYFLLSTWVFGGLGLFLLLWIAFFMFVDYRIYQRKKEIEAVFPDFLQLAAANINAGMPIDRALWFALRPRFGILAKEMQEVAKATMIGEKLDKALLKFSNKYESITITRALNLLLEGLESGGEVGDLLVKVSNNMRDTEILKKEMASSVTTYVIFILFATLGAAPFLFGLTTELIVIMSSIISNIAVGAGGSSFGGGMMTLSGTSISITDYQIFAVTSICMSSFFAAILISVIQKGNAKESLKKIPVYIIIGLANYFIAFKILNIFLGGMFN